MRRKERRRRESSWTRQVRKKEAEGDEGEQSRVEGRSLVVAGAGRSQEGAADPRNSVLEGMPVRRKPEEGEAEQVVAVLQRVEWELRRATKPSCAGTPPHPSLPSFATSQLVAGTPRRRSLHAKAAQHSTRRLVGRRHLRRTRREEEQQPYRRKKAAGKRVLRRATRRKRREGRRSAPSCSLQTMTASVSRPVELQRITHTHLAAHRAVRGPPHPPSSNWNRTSPRGNGDAPALRARGGAAP